MPASHIFFVLSAVASAVALCVTTSKIFLYLWRQNHRYTQHPTFASKTKVRVLTAMCAVLAIFSGLLLGFSSIRPDEKVLQVVLSLACILSAIYQSEHLLTYCVPSLWKPTRVFLVLYVITTIVLSALISTSASHIQAVKIILLSIFIAGHLLLCIASWCVFLQRPRIYFEGRILEIDYQLWWNTGLCCIAWLIMLASVILYLTSPIVDFNTSLWIDNMAALVPIVGVLFTQLKGALKEAQTSKRSKPQHNFLKLDSMSTLEVPPPVHVA